MSNRNLIHRTILYSSLLLIFVLFAFSSQAQRRSNIRTQQSHIAAGLQTTFQIINGTLWAWGLNSTGQLGDGTTTNKSNPIQIGSDTKWISISAGSAHSVALKSDGTLWTWGSNNNGQIGDGTNTNRTSPNQIGSDNKWIAASAGGFHTVALKSDGTLWAWGLNDNGQVGNGTTTNRTSPTQIGTDTKWISISAGGYHTLGIKSDGTLWAWGMNTYGQVGNATTTNRTSPVQIGSDNKWVSIDAGDFHSAAIKSTGTLWGWGFNNNGQVGNATITNATSPNQVGSDNKWVSVNAGAYHTLGIKSTGTLWGWGFNSSGQVGNASTTNIASPDQVGTDNKWTNVVAGSYHSFALKTEGTIWAWGMNNIGQLGTGGTTNRTSPDQVSTIATLNSWQTIASGTHYTFGIKSDGTLWGWGANGSSQLGNGLSANSTCATQIGTDNKWIDVAAGSYHTIGLKSDGTIWAWGDNSNGQLGDGTTTNRTSPVQIGSDTKWISISVGDSYTMAIKSDGTLWGWGYNGNGKLGDGTIIQRTSSVQIGTDTKWVSIATGSNHTLGIKSDGTLWAWGYNVNGQLGNGTTTDQSSPIQIGTDTKWKCVKAGGNHTIGLKSEGTLWAWGNNYDGQLGDGSTINKTSPLQIGSDNTWKIIAATKYNATVAIKSTGTLWAWGDNSYGQLGDATTTDRTSPVQIDSDNTWIITAPGYGHTIGVKSTRTSFCATGINNYGQLGLGVASTTSYICSSEPFIPSLPTNTTTYSASHICSGLSTVATVSGIGTLSWFNAPVGGTPLTTGTTYTTPTLTSNITYYVQAGASCARTPVNISVITQPIILSTVPNSRTNPGTVQLEAFTNAGILNWYTAPIGGTAIPSTNFPRISRSTIFYVEANNSNCISARTAVQATVKKVLASGNSSSMYIKSDGTLWAWGKNSYGQLGNGTANDINSPVQIGPDNDWVYVDAGNYSTFAIKSNGTLWAWGYNTLGQLGDNSNSNKTSPTQINTDTDWAMVAASDDFTVAIKTDGTLWSWGDNSYGQLGDGTKIPKNYPVKISNGSWLSVAVGPKSSYATAIKSDGTLWRWGDTPSNIIPTQIGTHTNWFSNIRGYNLAIKNDNTLWSLFPNPSQIGTDNDWANLSTGMLYNLAIKLDGSLWAWGSNNQGEFGNGTNISSTIPLNISNAGPWESIEASFQYPNDFTIGILSGGYFCGTGYNDYGQLNTGNTISQNYFGCSSFGGSRLSNDLNDSRIAELQVFPNPNSGSFTFQTIEKNAGLYKLIDQIGQLIQIVDLNESNSYQVNFTNLENGVYTLVGTDRAKQQRILVIK